MRAINAGEASAVRVDLVRGLPSMTSALEGEEGGSGKVDNSTDKLHDHVCDKGGRPGGGPKSEIFMDVIDGSPLRSNDACGWCCKPCF